MPGGNHLIWKNQNFVTTSWWGCKGDGVFNDASNLKALHDYANANKKKVVYDQPAYYLSSSTKILITTDVDFGNADITIDDSPLTGAIYEVYQAAKTIDSTTLTAISTKIKTTTTSIPELANLGNIFVIVSDSNDIYYVREGNNANDGSVKTEFFQIRNGVLLENINWDFTTLTSAKYKERLPLLTIENANFKYLANQQTDSYIQVGLTISRNDTVLKNIRHTVVNDSKDCSMHNGFIYLNECTNILLDDVQLQPRKYRIRTNGSAGGTYALGTMTVSNLTFKNVVAYEEDINVYWGMMGGNRLKNVKVVDSKINRFDSHIGGVWNLTIENSILGFYAIRSTGGGDWIVRNTTVNSNRIIDLREDYGCKFDGNIVIENVTVSNPSTTFEGIIRIKNIELKHNFQCGEMIIGRKTLKINNLNVITKQKLELPILSFSTKSTESNPTESTFKFFEKMDLTNLSASANGSGFKLLTGELKYFYNDVTSHCKQTMLDTSTVYLNIKTNVDVNLTNVTFYDRLPASSTDSSLIDVPVYGCAYTETYPSIPNGVIFNFKINSCKNFYGTMLAMPNVQQIENTDVYSFGQKSAGTRSIATFVSCCFAPFVSSLALGSNLLYRFNRAHTHLLNCQLLSPRIQGSDTIDVNKFKEVYEGFFQQTNQRLFIPIGTVDCWYEHSVTEIFTTPENYGVTDISTNKKLNYIKLRKGDTPSRPSSSIATIGDTYYDTTLSKWISWNGTTWDLLN